MGSVDLGGLWHALAGFGLGVLATLLGMPGWVSVTLLTAGGFVREWAQSDWDQKLTRHKQLEGAAWGVGAALGYAAVCGLRRVW